MADPLDLLNLTPDIPDSPQPGLQNPLDLLQLTPPDPPEVPLPTGETPETLPDPLDLLQLSDPFEDQLKKLDEEQTLPEQIINRGDAVVDAVSEAFTQINRTTLLPLESIEHFLSVPDPGENVFKGALNTINTTTLQLSAGLDQVARKGLGAFMGVAAGLAEVGNQFLTGNVGNKRQRDKVISGIFELADLIGAAYLPVAGARAADALIRKGKIKIPKMLLAKQVRRKTGSIIDDMTAHLTGSMKETQKAEIREVLENVNDRIAAPTTTKADLLTDPPDINLIDVETTNKFINAAIPLLKRDIPDIETLDSAQISAHMRNAVNENPDIFTDLFASARKQGLEPADVMDVLARQATDAGRILNQYSQLKKIISRSKGKGPEEARLALDQMDDQLREASKFFGTGTDAALEGVSLNKRIANLNRGLLIMQPATAIRNYISAVGKVTMNTIADGFEAALVGMFRGEGARKADPISGLRALNSIVNPIGMVGAKKRMKELVEAFPNQNIDEKLYGHLLGDFSLRKGNLVERGVVAGNILNRTQEYIVRRGTFLAKLDSILSARGTSLEQTIRRGDRIHNTELNEAAKSALDASFALRASTTAASSSERAVAHVLRAVNEFPGAALVMPFGNFMWNAIKTTLEFSPMGALKIASKRERRLIASGDSNTIGKALTGTAMFGMAYSMRSGNFPGATPGPLWYEFQTEDGKSVDMRPFSPIFLPHLYLADILVRSREGRLQDFSTKEVAESIVGRVPGAKNAMDTIEAGLKYFTDNGSKQDIIAAATLLAQGAVTGATRPLAVLQDVGEDFIKGQEIERETRLNLQDTLQAAIPGGSSGFGGQLEALPERESPLRAATRVTPRISIPLFKDATLSAKLVKQFTGLNFVEPKTNVEWELLNQGFRQNDITRRTKDKSFNFIMDRVLGPQIETRLGMIITSRGYQDFGRGRFPEGSAKMTRFRNIGRRKMLHEGIKSARLAAMKDLEKISKSFKLKRRIQAISKIDKALLNQLYAERGTSLEVLDQRISAEMRTEVERVIREQNR